jgi:hypothetical protein
MIQTRLWIVATIIAGIILVGFVLSVPHTRDILQEKAESPAPIVPVVSIHDVYRKGTHTLSGSVMAPNACTSINAAASVTGDASSTQSILLALTMPQDTGVCLQVPTPLTFSTTVAAPPNIPLTASVNGTTATVKSI